MTTGTGITISLEGKEYKIRPLTLGQLRDLTIAVVQPASDDPQEDIRRNFDRNIAVIATALSADHPDVTRDVLCGMRVTREEMTAANTAILKLSGLIPAEDAEESGAPGEEKPGASPA